MLHDLDSVKFGKSAPAPLPKLRLMTDHFSESLPAPPERCDWSKGRRDWGMMDNDKIGCCTIAAMGHMFQVWTLNARARIWSPSDATILLEYEAVTGYDPEKPSSDKGAACADVLTYLLANQFDGWTIAGFGKVDNNDVRHVKQCVAMFGGAYIGVALPRSIKGQSIWDIAGINMTGDNAPGSLGGHCINIVGYDGDYVHVITWGQIQLMTWRFFLTYCDESFCVLAQTWQHGGKTPVGLSLESLAANMKELAA